MFKPERGLNRPFQKLPQMRPDKNLSKNGTSILLLMLTALLAAGLSACGPNKNRLDYWLARPAAELINDWGQPESTKTLPNGNTGLVYSEDSEVWIKPRECKPEATRCNPGGYTAQFTKTTIVEVDSQGKVLRLSFHYPASKTKPPASR